MAKILYNNATTRPCGIVYTMKRIVVGLLLIFLIAGCGAKSEFTVAKNGYAQYGNFCGPGYPDSGFTNPDDDLKFLAEIEPYDLIDKACKIHDMCYAEHPESHENCDYQLLKNLESIYKKMPVGRCREVVLTIGNTFVAKVRPYRLDLAISAFFRELLNNTFYPFYVLSGKEPCGKISSYRQKLSGEEIILMYKR